jgi:hypothetical protein
MEEVKISIFDLYGIRNHLIGYGVKGLVNENGLSEGIKRRAHKVLKIVLSELEPINTQLDEIREKKDTLREKELLDDKVTIQVEKLDFKLVENVTLTDNYQLLYDTIFCNS